MSAPGIRGDFAGSCVACMRGTDTGLAFAGEPEWVIAGLVVLGVPQDEATALLSGRPDEVPDVAEMLRPFRVCEECATRAGFPVGLAVTGSLLPLIRPTGGAA